MHTCLFLAIFLLGAQAVAQEGTTPVGNSDLDSFMQQVLERREVNWRKVQDFIFREREELELRGLDIAAEESFRKEYDWYYRGGSLVRRLVRADGIKVNGPEEKWDPGQSKKKHPLSRESFFDFKFEPGNYFLVGNESFEGRKVLAVEYYPQHLFEDSDEAHEKREDSETDREFEQAFEKTSRVKLWILREEHQIVKMRFENVGLEFLPYRWLVRIDDISASLIMDKPVSGIWLPREIVATGSVSTAAAALTVKYRRQYFDYREAEVNVRFQFDGPPAEKTSEQPPKP